MDSSQLPIWLDVDIAVCAELVKQNEVRFTAFLTDLADTDLEKLITYSNSKGNEFMTSYRDILTHVALHGQYHRGQINTHLRADAIEPVNTDYISFTR